MFNQKYVLKNDCVKSTQTKKFMCYYSKMSMRFGFSKKEQAMYTVKNDHVLLSKKKTTANGQKSLIVYK